MKYIIELKDDVQVVQKVGVTENGNAFVMNFYKDQLEELNSDYINEHFGELQDEAYQRGLDDAMSSFKKLYSCGWERDWKAMGFEFDEGEWSRSFEYIIGHYTAAEIVEKVKAYEEKELHVGDEVIAPCGKAIVTTFKNDLVFYLYSVGDYGCTEPENLTKTGRHFDIQSILGAMQK